MPCAPSARSRARTCPSPLRTIATTLAAVAVGMSGIAVTAAPAAAGTSAQSSTSSSSSSGTSSGMTARQRFAMKADEVLHVVSNQKGDPYRYGATGPDAFDCSGLMYYSFRKALGRTLPRTANDQKRATDRIWHPRRNLRPGDLVFHVDGSYAYHVGIYAGHGEYWHAPHTGSHVKKDPVSYGGGWAFGRIINS